jgi:hypothetical protein
LFGWVALTDPTVNVGNVCLLYLLSDNLLKWLLPYYFQKNTIERKGRGVRIGVPEMTIDKGLGDGETRGHSLIMQHKFGKFLIPSLSSLNQVR